MITSFDKLIVAVIGVAVFVLNHWFGADLEVSQDWINSATAVLTPLLVYAVPNKES